MEKLIRQVIPDVTIAGHADSIEESLELLQYPTIELIFMDIQLADRQSFRIFEKMEVKSPVIFTTAHDEYAIKAFKYNSIDYLLKPIDEEELSNAIERFRSREGASQSDLQLESLMKAVTQMQDPNRYRKRFLLRSGQKLSFAAVEDVRWFVSEASSTFIVTKDNQRFLIDQTLDDLEQELDPGQFMRISRKFIVGVSSIQEIEPYFNNRLGLTLDPASSEEVIVSRQRVRDFKVWIDS